MPKKVKIDNKYKEIKVKLDDVKNLSNEEQYSKFEEVLNKMYEDKVKVTRSYVLKCIKLTLAKSDDYLYLSNGLTVEKDTKEIVFAFKKQAKKLPILILLVVTLLIGAFSATYSGLLYLERADLNKDIDGDGIADLNIDLDGDHIADLTIDTDEDGKPDININYKGNMDPIFNLDKDNDGIPDFNLVNKYDENCKVNCDTNDDGWPDLNYDIDGDGTADLDIDTDGDGHADTSIDLNGDLICDVMCDDNNDGVCDRVCFLTGNEEEENQQSGSSSVTGEQDSNVNSGTLSVVYEDFGELLVEGLVPDDQGPDVVYPEKQFAVTNLSEFEVEYKLTFIVEKNTFTSQNFQYKIESTNGGFSEDFKVAPWEETLLSSLVTIGPLETQEYTLTFKLHGTGEEQNYDQGKSFEGFIRVGD